MNKLKSYICPLFVFMILCSHLPLRGSSNGVLSQDSVVVPEGTATSELYVTTIKHTTEYFIFYDYLYSEIPLSNIITKADGAFEYNDKLKEMFIKEYNLGRENPTIEDKITWIMVGATITATAIFIARSER